MGREYLLKIMEVYRGQWKKDSSLLSQKQIDLYLLNGFAFPFWIQINGDIGSKKMISIDSGRNFVSSIKKIPRTPPHFLSNLQKCNDNKTLFSFLVSADRQLREFTVYLMEISKENNKIIPYRKHIQKN